MILYFVSDFLGSSKAMRLKTGFLLKLCFFGALLFCGYILWPKLQLEQVICILLHIVI